MKHLILTLALIFPGISEGADIKSLEKRVETLERAVEQLQKEKATVNEQASAPAATPTPQPVTVMWTCEITVSRKTYSATERTKILASTNAVEKCRFAGNTCGDNLVKCRKVE